MKANEAPEKIYLFENPITETPDDRWLSKRCDVDDIEYVRTDAFIEKACSWLRTHSEADYFELIPDANYCGAGNINKKRMIDEFRKYMNLENI
jgi:hypothetical protein